MFYLHFLQETHSKLNIIHVLFSPIWSLYAALKLPFSNAHFYAKFKFWYTKWFLNFLTIF